MVVEKKRFFAEVEEPSDHLFLNSDSDDEKSTSNQQTISPHHHHYQNVSSQKVSSQKTSPLKTLNGTAKPMLFGQEPEVIKRPKVVPVQQKNSKLNQEPEWKRFIGSMTVQAWATRPTMKPLKYQESFDLYCLAPKKSTFGRTVSKNASKFGDSTVVRLFSNPGSREIGRLPPDITDIVSPLLELNYLHVNTSVIMETDSRLSIGDSFYVQLDFYLTLNAFIDGSQISVIESPSKNLQKATFNFNTETEDEAILRLRQLSISRLFEKLNVKATLDQQQEDPITIEDDDEDDKESRNEPNNELNLGQLKQFYQANQQSALLEGLPESTPPSINFKLDLRPYQKHGLLWMLSREKELALLDELSQADSSNSLISTQTRLAINNEGMMNPLWKQFTWPSMPLEPSSDIKSYFYGNLHSGELSLEKPILKSSMKGGILADEMGLGKTISTYSLVLSSPIDLETVNELKHVKESNYAKGTTLIVVPMSLLTQWQNEFYKASNNPKFRCLIYYGNQTSFDLKQILTSLGSEEPPTVLLTTYGTILSEFTKRTQTGLFSVKFYRIVLDEGHTIRNRTAKTSHAVYALKLTRRWVLTGTPVINRLDDLYSLVKFLDVDPWKQFNYWKTFVTLPFEDRKIAQTLEVVKSILEPILLRRTKNMKQKNGQPLVELPEKEVKIVEVDFNEKEKKLYDWLKDRAARSFKKGLATGEVLKKYTQILTHILRLRQVCCHMDLVGATADELEEDLKPDNHLLGLEPPTPVVNENVGFQSSIEAKKIADSIYDQIDFEESECSICTLLPVPTSEMGITPCGHVFCLSCVLEHINFQEKNGYTPTCPNCRSEISKYKLFKVRNARKTKRIDPFAAQDSRKYVLYAFDPDKTSSKIQALILHLRAINTEGVGQQVVVFSQFSSYLDIIEKELQIQGDSDFEVYKFDGRLAMTERKSVLDKFNDNEGAKREKKTIILLLSLKAGGVGLNLTASSRAFLMDPWWSPSIEEQAIDRIHRIGQQDNVKVIRFIMKDSIETKMLKIQERKRQIGEAVGEEEEERTKRRIEEIQMLFEE